jgi:hypothetical protein
MSQIPNTMRHTLSDSLSKELNDIHGDGSNQNRFNCYITVDVLKRAKNMTTYFIIHRLVMAGYPCGDPKLNNIDIVLENIINNQLFGSDIGLIK